MLLENRQSVNLHVDEQRGLRIYHPNMDIFESEKGGTGGFSQDHPGKPGLWSLYTPSVCVLLLVNWLPFGM